jgi:carbamoylphosphate synthase small subunit
LAPEISISHVVRNFFAAEEFDGLFISNGPGDPEKSPGEKNMPELKLLETKEAVQF